MKPLEFCVVDSMDGTDPELYPYLPYILQDIWELGSDPAAISNLITEHFGTEAKNKKVLDIGCGKGTVCVRIALDHGCFCTGIDAISEFIMDACNLAKRLGVEHRCNFEVGDIRQLTNELRNFDIVIFGSTGSIFDDYFQALIKISCCLTQNGIVILDEGYTEDDNDYCHPSVYKNSDLIEQFNRAGFQLLKQVIIKKEEMESKDDYMFDRIVKRCNELATIHPEKKKLFLDYILNQKNEFELLHHEIVAATMVLKKRRLNKTL
ncbi:MAG TPA: class I SAM-dependent methyltransferase [Mariniphaga sp.]|nr:class I SAM-dependent methyltransferase [Mariniphaga sp.]